MNKYENQTVAKLHKIHSSEAPQGGGGVGMCSQDP